MLSIKHILHPTDFSDSSTRALTYACSFAEQFGAKLHLINAIQDSALYAPPDGGFFPPDYQKKLIQQAGDELASLPDRMLGYSGSVTRDVRQGSPFVEIVQYARENAIDLIVMGTHGYTGLKHLLIGSVAENVVRKAPCPVLTVHPEEHTFVMP